MKKVYLLLLLSCILFVVNSYSQTIYSTTVADVTLQCSGGSGSRGGIAYNPCYNMYYSACPGNSTYPMETFSATGGSALSSVSMGADYRALWWNNTNKRLEGNTYNSGGIYSNTLNAIGYAQTTTTFISNATMPSIHSHGQPNIAANIMYYYETGTLYRYAKSTNTLISATSISGLPTSTTNISVDGIVYTGYPGADLAVYNYVNRVIYFINSTTAAYSASCALPSTAPAPNVFNLGFANNRFFLYNPTAMQWYGYPVGNGPSGPGPNVSVVASNTLVCSNYPVTLTASGAASYTWSFGGNTSTAVVNPTANTVYTLMTSSIYECPGTSTIAVNVIPGPLITLSSSPAALCSSGTSTLTAGGGVNTYTWSNSSNSPSISVSLSTTSTYSVQGTNSVGCISGAAITVTVNTGAPVLSVTSSTNQLCLGKTATLTASGANTYSWSNNVTNGVSFNPSVTTTYTVTGQNACGISTALTTLSVNSVPVNLISTSTLVCPYETATLSASSAATSYTWYPGNASTGSIIVSPSVTPFYSVTVSNGTCFANATISVYTNPTPTISSAISSTNICEGQNVTLTASGGLTYTWTPGNLTGSTIAVSPITTVQYSVSGSNSQGCRAGSSQLVVVNPAPTLNVAANNTLICSGGTSNLTVTGSAVSYLWSSGSTFSTISVNPVAFTTYSVTGVGSNSCAFTSTISVAVFVPASLLVGGNNTICSGATASLTAGGGVSGTYTWFPGGTQSQNIQVSPASLTVYMVSAQAASANISCPSSNTILVMVNPNPLVLAASSRSVMCRNETVTLTANGANSYTWSANSSTVSIGNSPSLVITPSLVTTLNYSVTGSYANTGCSASTVIQVIVTGCTDIEEFGNHSQISIYPNPNNGVFTLEASQEITVSIINSVGQVIKQVLLKESEGYKAEVNELNSGVYFVVFKNKAATYNRKVIIQN